MPMFDYQCSQCGVRWEEYHSGNAAETRDCPECSGSACRVYTYPGERTAKAFDPIVVWVADDDPNRISVPGDANEPVQYGYHKVEIASLAEADRWANRMNAIETAKVREDRERERMQWDEITRERRADIRARIGSNPRAQALFKAVQEYVDRKRERRYSKSLDARVHFQVTSFDASNREGWSGPETGWKTRRK